MSRRFIAAKKPPPDSTAAAYWFAFAGNRLLCDESSPDLIPLQTDFSELDLQVVRRQYLGLLEDRPCFSVELDPEVSAPDGMSFNGLRQLYGLLSDDLFALAGRAVQIVDWDRNHQYCGRCGAGVIASDTEHAKRCPNCSLVNYPRLSPSIIVLVRRDQTMLLARSSRWKTGMYSVLAGFVEPGETLEQAVAREVYEEVEIQVKNIRYFGSQPWPFPNSLMIGFTADYAAGEVRPDPAEIADAGWYNSDKLPGLPPKMSIARQLIDNFLART